MLNKDQMGEWVAFLSMIHDDTRIRIVEMKHEGTGYPDILNEGWHRAIYEGTVGALTIKDLWNIKSQKECEPIGMGVTDGVLIIW